MATPAVIQSTYRQGMKRDGAREALGQGSVWNLEDWLPEVINSRLRKRGGYAHVSQDIHAVQASASYIAAGIVAEFSAGQSVLAVDEDGRVYEVESVASTENIGAALTTRKLVFYSDMVILADAAGAVGPKKITRSGATHTIADLAGTPPAGRYAVIYKDVLWLASSAAKPDRIWFSTAGDPESGASGGGTWDTTQKWLDSSYPITGMAALNNAVFVYSLARTMRVRGSIPPPDSDFIVDDPIFDVGCTDNRSIANYRDKVIWANANGLYFSDGTAMEDLTRICGMKTWWRDVMKGREGYSTGVEYSVSGWTIAGGMYGDYYFYSIMNGATLVDCGMVDMAHYTWHRLKNIDATFFFPRLYPEELFWGRRKAAYVANLSPIFAPVAANKNDGDGTAVLPRIELGYFEGTPGIKTLRRLYVGYDVRDAATDNPLLTVSYIDSPEEKVYTALSPTLPEGTEYLRSSIPLDFAAKGIAFKIEQTNPSADTRLYSIELEAGAREKSR